MIFVTLGTQDKSFDRLLYAVQNQIDKGNIKDKVVVQAGYTHFDSKDMEIFDLLPMEEFHKIMSNCDLLITHGGVGCIIDALNNNKKVIVAARLSKYKEHVNDHQKQIIEAFSKSGYVLALNDNMDNLPSLLKKSKKFKPKKFRSNASNMIKLIEQCIEE